MKAGAPIPWQWDAETTADAGGAATIRLSLPGAPGVRGWRVAATLRDATPGAAAAIYRGPVVLAQGPDAAAEVVAVGPVVLLWQGTGLPPGAPVHVRWEVEPWT